MADFSSSNMDCLEIIRNRLGGNYNIEEIYAENCPSFIRGIRIKSLVNEDLVDAISYRDNTCAVSSGEFTDFVSTENGYSSAYWRVLKMLRNKGALFMDCA